MRFHPLLPALLLPALLAASPARADDIQSLLKLREGLPIEVHQPKRGPLSGTLVRVARDHFCVQFGDRDTLQARCFPYAAITMIAPTDAKDRYYIIETR